MLSKNLKPLFLICLKEWPLVLAGMIFLATASAVNLIFPEIIRRILNDPSASMSLSDSWLLLSVLVALLALQAICFYFRSYFFSLLGQRIVQSLRIQLFSKILGQEIIFFYRYTPAELVSRLTSDMQLVQNAISVNSSVIIRYSLQVFVGSILMFVISWRLALGVLLILPPIVLISLLFSRGLKNRSRRAQDEVGRSSQLAQESFALIQTVKSFCTEHLILKRFCLSVNNVFQFAAARSSYAALFAALVSFLMNIAVVSVLFYGMQLVQSEAISKADLAAFMLYGVIVAVSFAFLASSSSELMLASGASERVFELLNIPLKEPYSLNSQSFQPINLKGQIEFRDVSFHYPDRAGLDVLSSISFTIKDSERLAIVGPSGAGKSTIVALLCAFFQPIGGKILLDQRPLTEYSSEQVRRAISLVTQQTAVFSLSVRENLLLGNTNANESELFAALKKVNLDNFVRQLPNGIDTILGEAGSDLSGGQRQRLVIARAFLKSSPILVLDEATSQLDSENEAIIQSSLDQLSKGRTCIIIAHRLATVKNCDRILVLDQGTILQQGSHNELSSQPGLYRALVERQELT